MPSTGSTGAPGRAPPPRCHPAEARRMSDQPAIDTRGATARLERELLARLGLGPGASNEQIESAHEEIAQFLDRAPHALRGWAARQMAAIDEAYALLRGESAELTATAIARGEAAPVAAA